MQYLNTKKMDDSKDSKSKPLRSTNIWTYDINNEVNDPCLTIPIRNTMIYHLILLYKWYNGSNQKSPF